MRKARFIFLTAAISLLFTAPAATWAQAKPVVILSISSVKDLVDDSSYLASLAGQDGMGSLASGMMKGYTRGLDPTRPLGLTVTTDGTEFRPLIVVPISDLDTFLNGLSQQFGKPNDAGDGILELAGPVPIFVKQQGEWAFAAQTMEGLEDLPQNPVSLLGGINDQYHIGIRAYMANIPVTYREMFLSKVKEGIELQLDSAGDPEGSAQQRKMLQAQIRQYEVMLNEVDQLTIGIKVDRPQKRVYVDVNSKAVPGTATARSLAMLKSASSAFTGFLTEDAAISGNSGYQYPPEQADQMAGTLTAIQPQIRKAIEDNAHLSDNAKVRDALNRIMDNLFSMVEETVQTGKSDSAMSVELEEGQIPRLILACHVAGTDKLEATLRELATMAKQDAEIPRIRFDVDQHRSVRFHQVEIPITDPKIQETLGVSKINLFVGLSETAICLSAGESSADSLKKAIDASATAGKQPVDPAHFAVHVAPIARTVASFMEKKEPEKASRLRQAVNGLNKDNDTLTGTGRTIAEGFAYRLELKEDVVRAIGAIARVAKEREVATSAP